MNTADLIAAAAAGPELPAVGSYLEEIAPTFSAATAATYRPYWRLAATRLGHRRLAEVTVVDLIAVVEEASDRAKPISADELKRLMWPERLGPYEQEGVPCTVGREMPTPQPKPSPNESLELTVEELLRRGRPHPAYGEHVIEDLTDEEADDFLEAVLS